MLTFEPFFTLLKQRKIKQVELIRAKVIGRGTMQRMRQNKPITTEQLDSICAYLKCQVQDICQFVKKEPE